MISERSVLMIRRFVHNLTNSGSIQSSSVLLFPSERMRVPPYTSGQGPKVSRPTQGAKSNLSYFLGWHLGTC